MNTKYSEHDEDFIIASGLLLFDALDNNNSVRVELIKQAQFVLTNSVDNTDIAVNDCVFEIIKKMDQVRLEKNELLDDLTFISRKFDFIIDRKENPERYASIFR